MTPSPPPTIAQVVEAARESQVPLRGKRLVQQWKRGAMAARPFCDYCNLPVDAKTATVDHILPSRVAKGWHRDTRKNFALACKRCNFWKANRCLSECGLVLVRRRDQAGGIKVRNGVAIEDETVAKQNRRAMNNRKGAGAVAAATRQAATRHLAARGVR